MTRLSIAISTCPNDTFAFHALLERKIDPCGFEFDIRLGDVQQLNQQLARGELDASKASFRAALELGDELCVLPVGAALGFGVGPVVLARRGAARSNDGGLAGRVLAPGAGTTATLLLRLFHPEVAELEQRVFSEIMPALERGEADFGACIHEGRFTWRERELEFVEDLGTHWERATRLPLPLGGIVARRALGRDALERLTLAVRASIDYAFAHRDEALTSMRRYAQEFSDDVLWKHVELYVNADTLALSNAARLALGELARRASGAGVAGARELEVFETRALERVFRIARDRMDALGANSIGSEGFVHLSNAGQLAGTLAAHYAGANQLELFEIDRARVWPNLRYERSRGGEWFPHLYRALEASDLVRAWSLRRTASGWNLPELSPGAAFDRPATERD